jgi:hypothetical protein
MEIRSAVFYSATMPFFKGVGILISAEGDLQEHLVG